MSPPDGGIVCELACRLMATAASRMVTVVVAASLEPTMAVTVAVPGCDPALRVAVAVPSARVVGRLGLRLPRVVVRITWVPAATGVPSELRAITVTVAVPLTGTLFGVALTITAGLVSDD